jgi:hypothetical protein
MTDMYEDERDEERKHDALDEQEGGGHGEDEGEREEALDEDG